MYVLIAVFIVLGGYPPVVSTTSQQIKYFNDLESCKEGENQLKEDFPSVKTSCIELDNIK